MKRENLMSIFLKYLLQHKKSLVMFLVFSVIFAVVFSLYDLQIEAVIYSVLLCIFFGFILITINFYFHVCKHRRLEKIAQMEIVQLSELPFQSGTIESDYQAIAHKIKEEMAHEITKSDMNKNDILEYFTLWTHQIKTPIAAMDLLLQQNPNSDIAAELFKISQYTDMALQYLRLGSDSTDYVLRPCCLDDVIRAVLRKYSKLFILKKLTLEYTPCELTPVTDEKWLSFVIEQVLSNAIKYTSSGTVKIYAAEPCTLVIEDSGIGIAPEDLPRIFEKGYTGYNGRTDKKSTGIGLFLCKTILVRLSHDIQSTSKPGKGTSVSINLAQSAPPMD